MRHSLQCGGRGVAVAADADFGGRPGPRFAGVAPRVAFGAAFAVARRVAVARVVFVAFVARAVVFAAAGFRPGVLRAVVVFAAADFVAGLRPGVLRAVTAFLAAAGLRPGVLRAVAVFFAAAGLRPGVAFFAAAGLRPGVFFAVFVVFAAGFTVFVVRPVARLAAPAVRPDAARRVDGRTAIACARGVPLLLSSVLMG